MTDRAPDWSPDYDGPHSYALPVTPHDTNQLTAGRDGYGPRAIYVGGAGNITCRFGDDTNVLFTAVPVGTVLRIRPTMIRDSGTTATAIVALY